MRRALTLALLCVAACSKEPKEKASESHASDVASVRSFAEETIGGVAEVDCPKDVKRETGLVYTCSVSLDDGTSHGVVVRYTPDKIKWGWDPPIYNAERLVVMVKDSIEKTGLLLREVDCGPPGIRKFVLDAEVCHGIDPDGKRRGVVWARRGGEYKFVVEPLP